MHRLKSIKLYFFSILKLSFLSFRNYYFKSSFYNKKLSTLIEIDGGINFDNSRKARKAGVDILVSGTTIFKENEGNLKKNIQLLRTG